MAGADLSLFEYDYDLTWAAFFLNADEQIYGRFGGRDASGADSRNTLPGLRHAMNAALETHKNVKTQPKARTGKPLRVEDYGGARRARGCIHCHQVWEFRRDSLKSTGTWTRDEIWVYPLPENVGISLDNNRGDLIKSVLASSPAEKAGLKVGDKLRTLNGYPIASFADVQFALHKAPKAGTIPFNWERDGKPASGMLEVSEGWRKTDVSWRRSMLDLLPSIGLTGDDLTAAQKRVLGLDEKRLAFKQEQFVHREAKAAGVQAGDIIIGVNGMRQEGSMKEFLRFVRQTFIAGDKITINVIRSGKRVDLPMTLK